MKGWFNHFLCCSFLLVIAAGAGPAQDKLPSKAEMRALLPLLNQTIQSNPNDAKSLCTRGMIFLQLDDLNGAVADSTRAIAADPSMAEGYNCRFVANMKLKNYQKALPDASEVIRLKNDADAYNNRGAAYLALKINDKAIQDFAKAMQLNKNSAVAYDGLGEAAYRLGKYEKAIAYCNRALTLDRHMAEAVYFRGKSFEALGKKDQAQKDLASAQALGYKPGEPFVYATGK